MRQSLHASPLDVSQAVLLQKAGGPAAVRQNVLRFTAEAIVRKARIRHNARILGSVDFEEVRSQASFSGADPVLLAWSPIRLAFEANGGA